jgi:alcohol dehydrogenase class IV
MKTFHLPTEIITGVGSFDELGIVVRRYGERALLVCGATAMRRSGVLDRGLAALARMGVSATVFDRVVGEPTLPVVEEGRELARERGVQMVVGLGGGSAMDTAKAIAGTYSEPGAVAEYHCGRPLERPGLPYVAVPTTAGTGAEVTKNAVLIDPSSGLKKSIRSDRWFARVALVDPELTTSMRPDVTASTGADALCQAIESFVSIGAQPITDALATDAICLLGRSLVAAYENGKDIVARADVHYGSLLAGMALANARLGGVHGIAHPLGGHYRIPHGVVCGLLLPHVMEYNLECAAASPGAEKYAHIAQLLGQAGTPSQAVQAVWTLLSRIDIPQHLAPLGVRREDFPALIEESLPSGSLKSNPRPLQAADVRRILERAM